jgi:hypothetical protein
MLMALQTLAPARFPAPTAAAAAPAPAAEPVAEPVAELTPEPVVEPEVEAGAEVTAGPGAEAAVPVEAKPAVEPPAADPRIAELEQRLAEQAEQLKGYRTAEQKAADNAELTELAGLVAAVKETYGEDTPIAKVMDKFTSMIEKIGSKAEAAQEVTVARDSDSAHQNARMQAQVPVMEAIYAAINKDPKSMAAVDLNVANEISQRILDEQGIQSISWKDTKALAAHYKEVEKRLVEYNPALKAKYTPAAPAAKPAASTPTIKPAAVKGPTTMSGIKGGQTLAPAKPVDLSKMSFREKAVFAERGSKQQHAATRH